MMASQVVWVVVLLDASSITDHSQKNPSNLELIEVKFWGQRLAGLLLAFCGGLGVIPTNSTWEFTCPTSQLFFGVGSSSVNMVVASYHIVTLLPSFLAEVLYFGELPRRIDHAKACLLNSLVSVDASTASLTSTPSSPDGEVIFSCSSLEAIILNSRVNTFWCATPTQTLLFRYCQFLGKNTIHPRQAHVMLISVWDALQSIYVMSECCCSWDDRSLVWSLAANNSSVSGWGLSYSLKWSHPWRLRIYTRRWLVTFVLDQLGESFRVETLYDIFKDTKKF